MVYYCDIVINDGSANNGSVNTRKLRFTKTMSFNFTDKKLYDSSTNELLLDLGELETDTYKFSGITSFNRASYNNGPGMIGWLMMNTRTENAIMGNWSSTFTLTSDRWYMINFYFINTTKLETVSCQYTRLDESDYWCVNPMVYFPDGDTVNEINVAKFESVYRNAFPDYPYVKYMDKGKYPNATYPTKLSCAIVVPNLNYIGVPFTVVCDQEVGWSSASVPVYVQFNTVKSLIRINGNGFDFVDITAENRNYTIPDSLSNVIGKITLTQNGVTQDVKVGDVVEVVAPVLDIKYATTAVEKTFKVPFTSNSTWGGRLWSKVSSETPLNKFTAESVNIIEKWTKVPKTGNNQY